MQDELSAEVLSLKTEPLMKQGFLFHSKFAVRMEALLDLICG